MRSACHSDSRPGPLSRSGVHPGILNRNAAFDLGAVELDQQQLIALSVAASYPLTLRVAQDSRCSGSQSRVLGASIHWNTQMVLDICIGAVFGFLWGVLYFLQSY